MARDAVHLAGLEGKWNSIDLSLDLKSSYTLLSGMLGVFLVLIAITLFRGLDVDCGCFGSIGRHVDLSLLLTDIVLLYLTLNILLSSLRSRSTAH